MNGIKGVVTRVVDETVGEMWSLYDGRDVLNEIDTRFAQNSANHSQSPLLLRQSHLAFSPHVRQRHQRLPAIS